MRDSLKNVNFYFNFNFTQKIVLSAKIIHFFQLKIEFYKEKNYFLGIIHVSDGFSDKAERKLFWFERYFSTCIRVVLFLYIALF